jgi:glyoxylase-like metal-dependent hydrolase (beta-lactamase superfamily II)
MRPSQIRTVRCIDTRQFGVPGRGAAYLVTGERVGLVETGTPRAADVLLENLDRLDLAYIFVTHVHLDHAGGAGAIARRFPDAEVVAHPRAVKHLEDPSRLIEGVRHASPDLFPLYGAPLPIRAAQIHAVEDGESFDLGGGVVLEAIHAIGHAPHHVCFFERRDRVLFTGDAAGNHGIPCDVPLTVPPRFDLDAALATLKRLRGLRPSALAFTHYGLVQEHAVRHLSEYDRQLVEWFERIAALRERLGDDATVAEVLDDPKYAKLKDTDRDAIEMCVRGALLTLAAEAG